MGRLAFRTTGAVRSASLAIREYGGLALASYGYDTHGRPTGVTFANGASQAVAFDSVGRLATLATNLAGAAWDNTRTLAYNPAGQIAQVTQSNDGYAFGALVNVDRPYSVNGLNQLTQAGAQAIGYDARGNLTSSGGDTFSYTSENLLTGVTGAASLAYDPVGRLWQTAGLKAGGAVTRFAYDGVALIAEHGQANQLLRRYVHGPGVDNPIVWYEGAGTAGRRFLHADERGSVVAVSDAGGAVLGVNTYDEYGIPAATNLGRFGYTGQTWVPEAGLAYYKARMYSPTLGRFMQADPIGYADEMNMYAYVGGDPVNFTDPTGMVSSGSGDRVCWRVGNHDGHTLNNPDGSWTVVSMTFSEGCANVAGLAPDGHGGEPGRGPGPQNGDIIVVAAKMSEDEAWEEYQNDLAICRSLRSESAKAKCYSSAMDRYAARLSGGTVPPLVTKREIAPPQPAPIPLPNPRCLQLRHPVLIGGCMIITG